MFIFYTSTSSVCKLLSDVQDLHFTDQYIIIALANRLLVCYAIGECDFVGKYLYISTIFILEQDSMNIKDMFVVIGFALMTTWGVDYFILSRYRTSQSSEECRSGQTFSAPEKQQVIKPLNVDVNFIEKKRVAPEVITELNTDWGFLTFSSDGASLERLEFKQGADNADNIITIHPAIARENKAFLVAFDQHSPYYFNLVAETEDDTHIVLTYEGSFDTGTLRKRFTIAKQMCKIDLTIELIHTTHANPDMQLRLFYPAPIMPDVASDVISALMSNVKGSLEKIPFAKLNEREGWWAPSIFGAENKYFVHAMVADPNNFTERAYFLKTLDNHLVSILEGPSSVQAGEHSWTISFYCGPKDAQAMALVNGRLEETLDYSGLLAPLSKLLLRILKFLYSYVHNYGLAILLLTLLIKLIMLPFTIKGEKSLKKSNEIQKKMQYLQQKYKHDPERLREEQAEIIKKHGMPQLTSCLPMLAQFPIFIALSRILGNSVELYRAPFFGWITDLSAPDPYYILPAIIILAMMLQGLAGDPKQRMMTMSMALVFGAFSANFAAGLVLYICASTLLGIVQMIVQKGLKVV